MKAPKVLWILMAVLMGLSLTACGENNTTSGNVTGTDVTEKYSGAHILMLNGSSAELDGNALEEYDYTRLISPADAEETFTGTEPSSDAPAYIAHDIIYYPEVEESAFSKEVYDDETEWVTHYTAEGSEDYLFGTLPVLGNELPTEMMHSAQEAYANPVLHITAAGTYILEGTWNGQIWVDLGNDASTDPGAAVTLILNGADITCTAAPALVFYQVYECDNGWKSRETYTGETDLTDAGAKIILADGTENNISGANVYRLLKPTYKTESSTVQKKRWKMDGALYSYMSILIGGETNQTGILNITSTTFEGLDSELHLTMGGGYINIISQDDGINVNEDGVSVFTMNGGRLTIFAGQGAEGDVVDSNGFITVNGGIIAGCTPSVSDNILDSDCGTTVSGNATVINGSDSRDAAGFGDGFGHGGAPMGEMPEGFPGGMPGGDASGRERPVPPQGGQPFAPAQP